MDSTEVGPYKKVYTDVVISLRRAVMRTISFIREDEEWWVNFVLKIKPEADEHVVRIMWDFTRERLVPEGMLSAGSFLNFAKEYGKLGILPSEVLDFESIIRKLIREGRIEEAFHYLMTMHYADINMLNMIIKELKGDISDLSNKVDNLSEEISSIEGTINGVIQTLTIVGGITVIAGALAVLIKWLMRITGRRRFQGRIILRQSPA